MSEFVQIGVTALRDPGTGEFLPAVPLYIKVETQEAATAMEAKLCWEIGSVFAERMREYVEANGDLKTLFEEEIAQCPQGD